MVKKSKVMSDDVIEEINSSHMGVGTRHWKEMFWSNFI